MGTNQIYELNRTASVLWELIGEGLDRAEIEARLLAAFDVDVAMLAPEIDALFAQLQAEHLVTDDDRD